MTHIDQVADKPLIKPRNISGFADYTGAQNIALSAWMRTIEDTYLRYGFSRLFPRPLELRSVLLSQGGIQKQVFGVSRLPNDTSTNLALPFDRTVPLANWVAMNAGSLIFPYKRFDISYSFRGERAQAGRFQGFFQADVDIIGQDRLDINADIECIAVLYEALSLLSLGEFRISLNHMRLAKALLREAGVSDDKMRSGLASIDKLGKYGHDATSIDLTISTGMDVETAKRLVEVFAYVGNVDGFKGTCEARGSEAATAFEELNAAWLGLQAMGISPAVMSFNPGIVRGLDYYSGIVFETFLVGHEGIGSIASGGRYDDLVSTFSKLRLPGVGGSIGLTRLFDTACKQGLVKLTRRSEAQVFVGFRTMELKALGQLIATALRAEGLRVDLFGGSGTVTDQFRYCSRKGIALAVMLMGDSSVVVKDMARGEQSEVGTIEDAIVLARHFGQG